MLVGVEKGQPMRGFFSAYDGDFTYGGVTLEQEICGTGDLTFGGTPADSISFELMNQDRVLSDFPWGKMVAYMGVKVAEAAISPVSTALCYCVFNGSTYTGRPDGVYKGSSKIYSSSVPITGLVGDYFGSRVIALGVGVCVSIDSSNVANVMTPHRLLARKLMSGYGISFTQYSSRILRVIRYDVEKKISETYEYVNLGQYVIERPDSLQNAVVTVNDANNILSLLDVDATAFISGTTFPITVANFTAALLADLNIDIIAPSASAWSASIASNPFGNSSYTKRDLLGYVAELMGKVVAFDGYDTNGIKPCVLKFVNPCGSSSVEEVSWGNIEEQTLAVKEYTTPAITKVQLKKSDGTTVEQSISRAAGDAGTYQISGNPLIDSIGSDITATAALGGFAFRPTSCDVIQADPSIEIGDIVTVKVAETDTEEETDVYGRPTGQTITNDPAVIPLMSRTLHWQGVASATYQATGEKERKVDKSAPVYQSAPANLYTEIYTENAIDGFSGSLDAEDVFNRLTDYGTIQGIFRDTATGDLYINGEWIQANTVRADSIETTDGTSWLDIINEFLMLATGQGGNGGMNIGSIVAYGYSGSLTFGFSTNNWVRIYPSPTNVQVSPGSYESVLFAMQYVSGNSTVTKYVTENPSTHVLQVVTV